MAILVIGEAIARPAEVDQDASSMATSRLPAKGMVLLTALSVVSLASLVWAQRGGGSSDPRSVNPASSATSSAAAGATSSAAAGAGGALPSPEKITRYLDQVKKRSVARGARRSARQKDERRALAAMLKRRLGADPAKAAAPDAAVIAELTKHARRVARLRRIRYLAALAGDYPTLHRADKTLAQEDARHQRWWRDRRRDAEPSDGGSEP